MTDNQVLIQEMHSPVYGYLLLALVTFFIIKYIIEKTKNEE